MGNKTTDVVRWTYESTVLNKKGKPVSGLRRHQGEWWFWPCPISVWITLIDPIRRISTKGVPKREAIAYSVSDLLKYSADALGEKNVSLMNAAVAKAEENFAKYKAAHPEESFS